jgi:hypothetical protein
MVPLTRKARPSSRSVGRQEAYPARGIFQAEIRGNRFMLLTFFVIMLQA